jgi:hypothetical protein
MSRFPFNPTMNSGPDCGRAGADMSNRLTATRSALVLTIAATLASTPAVAQNLPDAHDLVARHAELVNARGLTERGFMHTHGKFAIPGMGTSGELDVLQAAPNRMVMKMTMQGLGEIRSGFDGTVGWSVNPMEGPRLMQGPELLQLKDEANFGVSTRDSSLIASMKTVERVEVEGRSCFKVELQWKSGRTTYDCYDTGTGLLTAAMYTAHTAMGALDALVLYDDYRDFDGVRLATTSTQKVFGQQLVMNIESACFDPIDASNFALPAEIKALVAR